MSQVTKRESLIIDCLTRVQVVDDDPNKYTYIRDNVSSDEKAWLAALHRTLICLLGR